MTTAIYFNPRKILAFSGIKKNGLDLFGIFFIFVVSIVSFCKIVEKLI